LAPGLLTWSTGLLEQLRSFDGLALLGPRSGSKTENLSIPRSLPPGIEGFDCKVSYVETFPSGSERDLVGGGAVRTWLETVETTEAIDEQTLDGTAVLIGSGNIRYLAGWPDAQAMTRIIAKLAVEIDLKTTAMPEGVRRRCTGSHEFIFNHNSENVEFDGLVIKAADVLIRQLN